MTQTQIWVLNSVLGPKNGLQRRTQTADAFCVEGERTPKFRSLSLLDPNVRLRRRPRLAHPAHARRAFPGRAAREGGGLASAARAEGGGGTSAAGAEGGGGGRRLEQREEGVERGAADGGGRRRFASAVGETTVWVVTLCVSRDPNMGMGLLFRFPLLETVLCIFLPQQPHSGDDENKLVTQTRLLCCFATLSPMTLFGTASAVLIRGKRKKVPPNASLPTRLFRGPR